MFFAQQVGRQNILDRMIAAILWDQVGLNFRQTLSDSLFIDNLAFQR